MADGGRQSGFNFPKRQIASRLRPGEIVVDFFAGGGGASEALRQALGRDPDVAVNHDPDAIAMHAANHPFTRHMEADVWTVDILREVGGSPVGWFHASPDCTHFSQAKGGQPRSKATRSLSWVVLKVAGTLARAGCAPRIISLENVEQILKWGPLVAKRDKATGRVVKLDGTVAAPGERVQVWEQCLVPDKRHAGRTWDHFVRALRALGYVVEWRKLVACDYGAGTSRKRLFLVARRDGISIAWPEPTHGPGRASPYVTAADCIDFTVPCPSIFERKKPLADATMRRIARSVKRYVLDAADPFIVGVGGRRGQTSESSVHAPGATTTAKYDAALVQPTLVPFVSPNNTNNVPTPGDAPVPVITTSGRNLIVAPGLAPFITQHAQASADTNKPVTRPVATMCAEVKGGHFALVAPTLVQTGYGERAGQAPRSLDIGKPLGVAPAGGVKHAVVSAFLEQANGGFYDGDGLPVSRPASTITGSGAQQRLVTANLATLRRNCDGKGIDEQVPVICAGAEHHAVVECTLSPEHEAGALRVAAFLIKYYGTALGVDIDKPLDTVTTKDRLALVTVWVKGNPYVIVDIGLRMLRREELFRAQGFPADYIIDRTADGRPLSISKSVRMVGNSVSPPAAARDRRSEPRPIFGRHGGGRMTTTILTGDCRELLRTLPDASVHTCVTSPPYFGLRDYGVAGQIGLEETLEKFIAELVGVFAEVRRVLRDDGTLWLNLGDSYAGGGCGSRDPEKWPKQSRNDHMPVHAKTRTGLKAKNLMGVPWRVAFALQADGWCLRQDIIWAKPNPMPESVRDRCTKAHEYLFLLSKSERYYFDQAAISETLAESSLSRLAQNLDGQAGSTRVPGKTNGAMKAVGPRFGGSKYGDDDRVESRTKSGRVWTGGSKRNSFARTTKDSAGEHGQKAQHRADREPVEYSGSRNKRSVWTVATQPFKEAHFATFPPALVTPCVLAGAPAGGVVLDPFGGSGTTGLVAESLGRDSILIELNPTFARMAHNRTRQGGLQLKESA